METIKDYTGRDYRTVWQGPKAQFEDRFETKIVERLLSSAPGWFVDLGAGYGRLQPLYARPGRRTVLVDYAVDALELAARNLAGEPDVHFVAANAYHLPFRDEAFDAGISIRTYHHMNVPQRFMHELGRTARSGARILLEYSNKRNLLRVLRHGRRAFAKDHEDYGELLFGSHPDYFAELCAQAGFTIAGTEGTAFLPRIVERIPAGARALAAVESALDFTLGKAKLAPMTFADLVKTEGGDGHADAAFAELLRCPGCGGSLEDRGDELACADCEARYPRVGAVLDLRHTGDALSMP